MYSCGLLTISDTCFFENKEDNSGMILVEQVKCMKRFDIIEVKIVPDEIDEIEKCLIKWSDDLQLNLIITTGGTGFTPRDLTPEATLKVIDKHSSSLSQMLLIKSLGKTDFAALSRGISGIRKSTLIINFPGSPKAVKEYMSFLVPILPHALDQIINNIPFVKKLHSKFISPILTKVSTIGSDIADRARFSEFPLFTVEKAQEIVFSQSQVQSIEEIDITDALFMVTSDQIKSRVNVPPFHASIKDGYAVQFSDGNGRRTVTSVENAGDENLNVSIVSGTCARISTGAKVPPGSDSVVQVEDTVLISKHLKTGEELEIEIKVAPTEVGQDIRPIGNDLKIGEVIIEQFIVIGPTEIGLMAMGGINKVKCFRKPTVGILSTGNELVSHKSYGAQDKIIDCNRPLLISLMKSHNFNVIDLGIVKDEPQILMDELLFAFQSCDVIVTTGGVSMGEKDYLKSVLLEDLNANIHFGRIFMKPGKPMTFSSICGSHTNDRLKLIFSLPGNPVSAFVTSYLFVIPALRKMSGIKDFMSPTIKGKLMHDVKLDSRPEYRRCCIVPMPLSDGGVINEISCKEFGNQMSSRLSSCLAADGFVCLPPSSETCNCISSGSTVTVIKL